MIRARRDVARRAWGWRIPPVLLAMVVAAPTTAGAHPTPGSIAIVDFTVDGARIEQDVPVEELERALHQTLANQGESAVEIVRRHGELLRRYAGAHLRATAAGNDTPWTVDVTGVIGHDANDGPRARFRFALRAPRGEESRSVHLHDDIVSHEVISHYTAVYVRSDWAEGAALGEPRLAGVIHAGHNDVIVRRGGSFWHGLGSVIRLGVEHITTGTDHLMFLFALVLVAPVGCVGRRWNARRDVRDALIALARVASAFTIGHSATLALGVLGGVTLPSAVVEAGIAASILVTSLHALRPIFPRREALVAGAFGLIHGLAFASTLAGRDLGRAQAAWTLLGFNVGIELAQLGLLTLVVPWLLILARTRAYRPFRVGAASVTALLAVGWLLERTAGLPNPTARPLAWIEAHPLLLLVALAVGSLLARLTERSAPPKLHCQ